MVPNGPTRCCFSLMSATQPKPLGKHVNPARPRVNARSVVVVVKGLRAGIMALDFRTESGLFQRENN